jgi:D-sedoheptulose 7-phosphate isomerase
MAMTSIALTGAGGGRLAAASDILIAVPSRATPRIQEIHTCLYHYICEQVEARIAG